MEAVSINTTTTTAATTTPTEWLGSGLGVRMI